MACSACVTGSLDEGEPKGCEVTLGGVPCYLSEPATPNGCAVVLATDVFGYTLINARLIADAIAAAGFLVAVPDLFNGDPINTKLLELFESLPDRSPLGKLVGRLQLGIQIARLGGWLRRHPTERASDIVAAVGAELRRDRGVTKVGVIGYCYGGKVGVELAGRPCTVDAVCVAHPSHLKVPDDMAKIQVPMLFLCAETDHHFPEKVYMEALRALEEREPGLGTFILYPGTQHGFATRGSKRDPKVRAARADALEQGIRFFKQHLAGEAPQPAPLDAAAPPPPGVRLALAPRKC